MGLHGVSLLVILHLFCPLSTSWERYSVKEPKLRTQPYTTSKETKLCKPAA